VDLFSPAVLMNTFFTVLSSGILSTLQPNIFFYICLLGLFALVTGGS
jgi:hypothetical protein